MLRTNSLLSLISLSSYGTLKSIYLELNYAPFLRISVNFVDESVCIVLVYFHLAGFVFVIYCVVHYC